MGKEKVGKNEELDKLDGIDSDDFFKDTDDGFSGINFDELDEEDHENYREIEKELNRRDDIEAIKKELEHIDDRDTSVSDTMDKAHTEEEENSEQRKNNSAKSNKKNEIEKLKKKMAKMETVVELQAIRIKNLEDVFFGTAFKKMTADVMKERIFQSLESDDIQKSMTNQERQDKKIDFDSLIQEGEVNMIIDETKKESKKKTYFISALIIGVFLASVSFYADFVAKTKYPPVADKLSKDHTDNEQDRNFTQSNVTIPVKKKLETIKSVTQTEEEKEVKLKAELLEAETETIEKLNKIREDAALKEVVEVPIESEDKTDSITKSEEEMTLDKAVEKMRIKTEKDVLPLTHRAKNIDDE